MMNRRDFMRASLLGTAGATLAGCAHARSEDAQPPNILFFLIDDQRNTTLGCAGDPIVQTPNIDRLAQNGVMFRNAFVTTSICAASRASIMTGLTERTHGYTFGKPPVPEPFTKTAYPALLRQAGYRTGFFGKFGAKYQGLKEAGLFDAFESRDRPYLRKQKDGRIRHIDEMNTEQAVDFVRSSSADTPFCLSVSFSSV
ncbi:MAG: sulfatase-like hydrolase/transferase, partial [bacterium]|nr:sulfatase-like hydrolase/transferase [bacterium]